MRRGLGRQGLFNLIVLVSILMALSGTWSCAKTVTPEPPKTTPGGIRFTVLAPEANNVFLVGSFNGWAKRATPMTIVDGALWSVVVPLKEGEYPFMYVIDGVRWVTPPYADDFVTDGFGQTNGVVIVR